ncbi:helix-turn-helix transcriptional regulator [Streptomyces sp. NPDC005438]|uniref:helix-turn-helix domain-containing protein n=1 Tax=Streptomyces sp. NPDC005438 TaxID=3156880 RepID=UPI0033A004D3
MPAGGRPTIRSRRLGKALRHYRLELKVDQQEAADCIAGSKTKISRIEQGLVSARPGDVRLLLELYQVQDREIYRQLEQLARDSNKRGWWLDYQWAHQKPEYADLLSLESDANYIRSWQPLFLPGLLQTDDYLRALLDASLTVHSPEVVDGFVAMHQTRQKVLAEKGGARFSAVIWEPALTAPMPSPKVHREQLEHLWGVAQQQNVSIQVLPASEWAAAHMSSHFLLFSMGGPGPALEAVAFDTNTCPMIVEEYDEIEHHSRIFEALRSAALNRSDSTKFLESRLAALPDK